LTQKLTGTARRRRWVNPAELRLAGLFVGTIVTIILISTRIHPPHLLHELALFGHLAALLVGFGSVLAVDWFGLLFLARRMTMGAVLVQADRMTPMIWLGLLGLTLSGAFLEPDLGSSLVIVKMLCVLGVSVIGVLTLATKRQMVRRLATLPRGLMLRGMILASASQAFWWTAVIIGFHGAQT
jgi:hypothetical protein